MLTTKTVFTLDAFGELLALAAKAHGKLFERSQLGVSIDCCAALLVSNKDCRQTAVVGNMNCRLEALSFNLKLNFFYNNIVNVSKRSFRGSCGV